MNDQAGKNAIEKHTKLYGLDHLRALAIVLVILFHYGRIFPHPEWTNVIGKFGWTGVDLFFVLSGYLIASPLFATIAKDEKISLKIFFQKRFFRIIPAYAVVVTLYFCFPYVHEREALAPLWKYLSFTQNLALDLRTQGTFSHAWSLCIEEQFYLCMPFILMGLAGLNLLRKGYWLIILLFLFGFCIRYYAFQYQVSPFTETEGGWSYWNKWIYYPTYCRLDGLLMGVSIAALFRFKPKLKEQLFKYGNLFFLISIVVLTGAYILCINEQSFKASVFGFPLVSIGYGLMVMGAISPGCFLYRFTSNLTSTIAMLSYSVYLVHKIVIHITQDQFSKLNIPRDSNSMFLLCIITSVAAAILMNRTIEKPFLKLRDKILASSKPLK